MQMRARQDFPSLDQLLIDGGDGRIALHADGLNKYGCAALPQGAQSELFAFGSATASCISAPAYAAAARIYPQLLLAHQQQTEYAVYAREIDGVRHELKQLCGLGQRNDIDIVFAASGTDLHLIAAQLYASFSTEPTLVIMSDANETGSSVPSALAGNHFNSSTAFGEKVRPDAHIEHARELEVASIKLRKADGSLRSDIEIDGEIELMVSTAVNNQQKVLLILMDVTKTGLVSPSVAMAIKLGRQYPQIQVLVDSCQFRVSNATLRAYLDLKFMVAITGSKFLGGPSFSGALLIPSSLRPGIKSQALPVSLSSYSSRADWPSDWTGADNLPARPNFGLLLRWLAALEELRVFRALPDAAIYEFIRQFQTAIYSYFNTHACFSLLDVASADRSALRVEQNWDQCTSIFSFMLLSPSEGLPLGIDETKKIYQYLQKEKGMQLGQPVVCGMRDGKVLSALRLCLSTRLIATAVNEKNGSAIIAAATTLMDEVQQQILLHAHQ